MSGYGELSVAKVENQIKALLCPLLQDMCANQ